MNKLIIYSILIILVWFSIAPHWAILAGLALSLVLKLSAIEQRLVKTWSSRILQASIVLLGSALNFQAVINQGFTGVITTLISLSVILFLAELLAWTFKVDSPLSHLIAVGTAICGGSAIGAVSPVIKADNLSIAVAMGIVFILNAFAIISFPVLGNFLQLGQNQFGTWAALAIHDTSAVVAASSAYGEEALATATTLKLTRALWIMPVALMFTIKVKSQTKVSFPWFILLFLVMSLIFTTVESISFISPYLKIFSKHGFTMTLFLIGLSLNRDQLKQIQSKTILYALALWILAMGLSLGYVKYFIQG
jgi:uncharacterized integral membrane protein (TIGR00698 family)